MPKSIIEGMVLNTLEDLGIWTISGFIPGDSYVVPFWVVDFKPLIRKQVVPKKDLYRSLQVTSEAGAP